MRIFKDEEKLSLDYVPPALPHREKELHLLNTFFSGSLKDKPSLSHRVIISGAVGTGKSALSKLFGRKIEKEAAKTGVNIQYVHINCRINRTLFTVLKRIIEQLRIPLPRRGYSNEELIHGLSSYLDERQLYLILALDEIESLIREESSEPFYYLTRIGEDRQNSFSRMSLICILRNPEVLSFLDRSTQSTLQRNVIHLEEYTYPQLYEIVKYRTDEAFEKDVVLDDTGRLIADIASERGDARHAIELL
ncbi:MAG: AAA family ATPase, partial [Aigarchaeota archaeon]|nr:AAA family ATPase [Aigarchaeota archaeon]